ncbi:hypothetical protein RHSIM_Rhsim09G0067500 [Rhododendron simsii]|uniref:Uncharacterized protein n=1 Tax=Rhododendron simsii TaxID=118357 RepID=A0A834LDQ5_RHOSS|nr:hypothetical protein RHSIM_Rhsim09G0067500 [Rhododendron simsii]
MPINFPCWTNTIKTLEFGHLDALISEEEKHVEEEPEEEDPEEEEPEEEDSEEWENEEEPELQSDAWLNDHGMAEQVQVEIEAIPKEEPELKSDVEELWDHLRDNRKI